MCKLTYTVTIQEYFLKFCILFDCIQIGRLFLAMMSDGESRDKAGEASCSTEVPSGYLKHSASPKIADICHVCQPFYAKKSCYIIHIPHFSTAVHFCCSEVFALPHLFFFVISLSDFGVIQEVREQELFGSFGDFYEQPLPVGLVSVMGRRLVCFDSLAEAFEGLEEGS